MDVVMDKLIARHSFLLLALTVVSVRCAGDHSPHGGGVVVDPCDRPHPCQPDTLVANPYVCAKYWKCTKFGNWEHKTCPVNDQFDSILQSCVRYGNATCQSPCKPYCKPPNTCLVGMHVPDPYDCRRFFMCEFNTQLMTYNPWRAMQCTDGSKFDTELLRCVTDSPYVACHPSCALDPCDGILMPCPEKDIRMGMLNYSAAYYECTEKDSSWKVRFCGIGETFDYRTSKCSLDGLPHPGCMKSTMLPSTVTTSGHTGSCYARAVAQLKDSGQPRPEIRNQTLVQKTDEALEEAQVVFESMVEVTIGSWDLEFIWFLNKVRIVDRGRFNIYVNDSCPVGQGICWHTSRLTISKLLPTDSGLVKSKLTIDSEPPSTCQLEFAVLPKPTVKLSRMTATVTVGDSLETTCTAHVTDTGAPSVGIVGIKWFKNDAPLTANPDEVICNVSPQESRLNLFNIASDNIYGCQANNTAGLSPYLQCEVTAVPKEMPRCPTETVSDVLWSRTAQRKMDRQKCPGNATGTATRVCQAVGEKAIWDEPNLNNCVDPKFQLVLDQISSLKSGLGSDSPEVVSSVAESLAMQTNIPETNGTEPEPIKPGNLNVSVSAIKDLADLHEMDHAAKATDKEVKSVVQAASNLLSTENMVSWRSVLKDDKGRAIKIMRSLEQYTGYVAELLGTDQLDKLEYDTDNVVLSSEIWEDGNLTLPESDADWVAEELEDGVLISNSTLSEIASVLDKKSLVVSSTYYRTLESLIPVEANESVVDAGEKLVSRILAVTVEDFPDGINLENPIRLQFGNRKMFDLCDTRLCSFWNYTMSGNYTSEDSGQWSNGGCRLVSADENITTCDCDHMTNFAILVSHFRPEGPHHNILSIITTVGLSFSIVCLLATVIIYVVLWKTIKSDYALMLINLCAALAAANLIFLLGIQQTASQVVCGVVAVLLHYLYLATFFLMFAESVELLLYIVYVFHVHTNKETAMLLAATWGSPIVIIAICLGVTKGEGYGNDRFCWLSVETGLIWAFLGPILAVMLANFPILGIVIKKIYDSGELRRESKSGRFRSALWNMVVLAPLLGLSWTFGLFSLNESTIVFQYIFTSLNAFQGLFIFIFHCLFNKRLRDAFIDKFSVESSSNITSTSGNKQRVMVARKSSASVPGSKFIISEDSTMGVGVFKSSHSDTETTSMLSHDNPAFSLDMSKADVTNADVTIGRSATEQSPKHDRMQSLSMDKPDIVQTLPEGMHMQQDACEHQVSMETSKVPVGESLGWNKAGSNPQIDDSSKGGNDTIKIQHKYASSRV